MGDLGINTTQEMNVISGQGATRTLLPLETGSTCVFDRAAGIVYTLPPATVGVYFEFTVATTITSNAATAIAAGTDKVQGSIQIGAATGTAVTSQGNGTSHVKVAMNGTTTGGVIGTHFRVFCVKTGLWNVFGQVIGSGSVATPFA